MNMKIGTAIAVVGIWFSVVAAIFLTTEPIFQALLGVAGFLCALLATIGILMTYSGHKHTNASSENETKSTSQ